jgi:hypothetical protein
VIMIKILEKRIEALEVKKESSKQIIQFPKLRQLMKEYMAEGCTQEEITRKLCQDYENSQSSKTNKLRRRLKYE